MHHLTGTIKHRLKKVPYVMPVYRTLRTKLWAHSPYVSKRTAWNDQQPADAQTRTKLLNLLDYTKTSGSGYEGAEFPAGYHEITIHVQTFAGQRKPTDRLNKAPYDFAGKTVLDIGCNQGGMVFALEDQLKWGIGVDYDYRMINACNAVANELRSGNTRFYTFDVDRDPHGLLQDFLPESKVDVVFLLAVCFWVNQWKELITYCARISENMLFEANGDDASMAEQIAYLHTVYSSVEQLTDDSSEDTTCRTRKLFWLSNPK